MLHLESVTGKPDGLTVNGVVILSTASVAKGRNGDYMQGKLKLVGGAIDFKVWGGALFDELLEEQSTLLGKPISIVAKVNVWNSSTSLIITSYSRVNESDIDLTLFHDSDYDPIELEKEYWGIVTSNISENLVPLFKEIYSPIRKRFREEYAASSIHDAVRGGLIAHTTKMLRILDLVMSTYPNIGEVNKDLLYMGLALHDLGKIYEYNMGSRTPIAFATHNFLGQRYLFQYEDKLIEYGGEDFYMRLQAIIMQHHGEFGEPCQTVEGYIIHLVDMFESRLTMLDESLPAHGEIRVEFGKYRLV